MTGKELNRLFIGVVEELLGEVVLAENSSNDRVGADIVRRSGIAIQGLDGGPIDLLAWYRQLVLTAQS
ncbi:MAG: hypothetical protein AAF605_03825 [Myxococcota bacterium]